jgi:hypothetical protein
LTTTGDSAEGWVVDDLLIVSAWDRGLYKTTWFEAWRMGCHSCSGLDTRATTALVGEEDVLLIVTFRWGSWRFVVRSPNYCRAMPTIMLIRGFLDGRVESSSLSGTATSTTMAEFLEFLGLPRDADEEVGETLEPISLTQEI